jgi:hypothetical protein
MYRLKPEDVAYLKQELDGKKLIQVCVGQYDLQFHFHPSGDISITGRCELHDCQNTTIDDWEDGERSEHFRFLEILGQSVASVVLDTEKSFQVRFSGGYTLVVIDNCEHYESFSVGTLIV